MYIPTTTHFPILVDPLHNILFHTGEMFPWWCAAGKAFKNHILKRTKAGGHWQ